MKDPNLVLEQKECDLARVRNEVHALHVILPLLADEQDVIEHGMSFPPRAADISKNKTTGGSRSIAYSG